MAVKYHIVETEVTKPSVNEAVLDAFCYGIFSGSHRTFYTIGSPQRLVFVFAKGEDALAFKLREQERHLLEIMDPAAAKRYDAKKTNQKKISTPNQQG